MSVLVGPDTRLLVQGLGRDGSFQSSRCREYGTNMVAAVHPGRGGQKFEDAVPIYESAAEAVDETGANVGVIFVPAPFAADAIIEQVDAGLGLIIAITERIPVLDMFKILAYMKGKDTRLIGPELPRPDSTGDPHEDRHNSGEHSPRGADRRRLPKRDADV